MLRTYYIVENKLNKKIEVMLRNDFNPFYKWHRTTERKRAFELIENCKKGICRVIQVIY